MQSVCDAIFRKLNSFIKIKRLPLLLVLLLLGLLLLLPAALFADDTYLKELESEAKKLDSVSKTKPANNKPDGDVDAQKQRSFELMLKSSRPSTYHFYTKLNQAEKNQVFLTFKQDNNITSASKKVFDLYFEKNK